MNISYNWLKEHIDITEPPEKIAELLTGSGLEVEKLEKFDTFSGGLEGLVVGEVETCEKHPNADRLKITTVNTGERTVPIVCGAPNIAAGQKVVVAPVGTVLHPVKNDPLTIKKAKIRGEVSEGMICAEDEIGLGESHEGIIVLSEELKAGTALSDIYENYSDFIFEIGLTPNRGDATSHLGVARDLKALLHRELKDREQDLVPDNQKNPVKVTVEDHKACPRYSGITIENLEVTESPEWLKNKLRALGLSPINNVVDITNFILHDLGQPLHAFDLDQVSGNEIIVKTEKNGTEFVTLDGEKRKLNDSDLMICHGSAPMCIAGVFGGIESGVTESTTSIFLESAYFAPDFIRKTATSHGLKTDASFRYERGTDPDMTVRALKKAAKLIRDVAGGEITSEIIDIYPEKISHHTVDTSYEGINRLIGISIPEQEIKKILEDLEIQVVKDMPGKLTLSVPPYRVDVRREADIIEEVIRIYGFDKITTSELLNTGYLAEHPNVEKDKLEHSISTMLTGSGFNEIVTNSLSSPEYSSLLGAEKTTVQILNKLSEELGIMRQSLLFTGLEVLLYNINRRQQNLKMYEFGKIYDYIEGVYSEKNRLALFLTGNRREESWHSKSEAADFFDLKSEVIKILNKLGIEPDKGKKSAERGLEMGLDIYSGKNKIAYLGQVSEEILKKTGIGQEVYFAELDMDNIISLYTEQLTYQEVSKFPEVRRDLSLVLEKRVTFSEIKSVAEKTEKDLLRSINVFDTYEGQNLGEGKKSYSVSFTLLDQKRTLTDEVIDSTMEKLIKAYEQELGAIIRR